MTLTALPTVALATDPYAEDVIVDRLPMQREIREAAPIVFLEKYGVWATGRYDIVREVFADWQHFKVGAGIGVTNFYTEEPWRPPACPTEADPPLHDMPRRVLTETLNMRTLQRLGDHWGQVADDLVDSILERGEVDGMHDVAAVYPLQVFPDAVGLGPERREDLLAYGDLVFNAFGPKNDLFDRSAQRLADLSAWVNVQCQRENLAPGGFGAKIWEAADRGELDPTLAPLVVRSLLSAGVDTTVHGIAAILHVFATHPEAWQQLRADHTLARRAFDEVVRWGSPLQAVFHTTNSAVELAGTTIGKHEKIMLLLGAANRDPRRWEDPDSFSLDRDPSGHLGFGMGLHQCVGQHIARMEAESLLIALAKKVERIELVGEPVRGLNNSLQTWDYLPLKFS